MIAAALLACAVNVADITMDTLVHVESGGRNLALHVNHLIGPQPQAATKQEAVAIAQRYIADGFSVDLGLAQINSRNLSRLGYSIEDSFEPCKNLAGGAQILTANYASAAERFGPGQRALMAALSAYNTGDFYKGVTNGYLAKYFTMPAITIMSPPKTVTIAINRHASDTESWD